MPRYVAFSQTRDPQEVDDILMIEGDYRDMLLYIVSGGRWMASLWDPANSEYRWAHIPEGQIPKEYRTYLLLNPVRN